MRIHTQFIVWSLCVLFFAEDIWADDTLIAERNNLLLLPASRAAADRLQTPTNLVCSNTSMRSVLSRYGREYQFVFWIDRRVDADSPLELSEQAPLQECLNRMAAMTNAEAGIIENIVVIAPRGKVAAMQAAAVRLHDQLTRNSGEGKAAKLQPLEWPMLTTPNEFAGIMSKAWQLKLPHAMPHDLMDAGSLPPCTFATQLTLLYGGFNEAVTADETGKLSTRPLDITNVSRWWKGVYSLGRGDPNEISKLNSKVSPVSITDRSIEAGGDTEFHLRLLAIRDGGGPATRPGGNRPGSNNRPPRTSTMPGTNAQNNSRSGNSAVAALEKLQFTFELKDQTIEAAMKYLAQNLKFELKWADNVTSDDKSKLVTLKVEQAPVDDMLTKLGKAAGLSIKRTGTTVEVSRP
ncbi:MAG: hypothetical protein U0892_18120 [Pirellulales bacterium]